MSLDIVLLHTLAVEVHDAEIVLGAGVSLLGRFAEPPYLRVC